MKKITLSLGLLVGIVGAANAQATFGVKAGGSLTNFTGKDVNSDAGYKLGYHAGVVANFAFDAISIQPEILFSTKGAQSKTDSKSKVNANYIDIPVMVQYNADGLFFEAGPQLGILASAKETDGTTDLDVKSAYNSVDFGYAVGLGYKLESGPMVGLRYNGGITSIVKTPSGGTDVAARNSAFQLYVGYMFGGK